MKKYFKITLCLVLLIIMSGCDTKKRKYDEAMELFKNEQFEEALPMFKELEDYENSKDIYFFLDNYLSIPLGNLDNITDTDSLYLNFNKINNLEIRNSKALELCKEARVKIMNRDIKIWQDELENAIVTANYNGLSDISYRTFYPDFAYSFYGIKDSNERTDWSDPLSNLSKTYGVAEDKFEKVWYLKNFVSAVTKHNSTTSDSYLSVEKQTEINLEFKKAELAQIPVQNELPEPVATIIREECIRTFGSEGEWENNYVEQIMNLKSFEFAGDRKSVESYRKGAAN